MMQELRGSGGFMRLCVFLLTFLCFIQYLIGQVSAAQQNGASPVTYYVDNREGSDSNSGKSAENPWRTLDRVNAIIFQPGDKILFKADTRYQGRLKPQGSGGMIHGRPNPVIIDMYGDGGKPLIEAGGAHKAALYLYNVEYWEINNLEITNTGKQPKAGRSGVYVHIKDFDTAHHIQLKNLH
ncbi:MAG: hypothetical protein V3R68_05625, partial [Gammaproteobacteria bacterium]